MYDVDKIAWHHTWFILHLLLSSMVIRDLTLRSAASFGSFHLIRLLYDEYMYYLVEHRVAQAKVVTPIAVMGEVCVRTSSHFPTAAPASSWRCVSKWSLLCAAVCQHHQEPDLPRPGERWVRFDLWVKSSATLSAMGGNKYRLRSFFYGTNSPVS